MADEEQAEDSAPPEEGEEAEDFKYIVRVANTDLDGHKPVQLALTGVKGIGDRIATILTDKASVDRTARIGDLEDEEIEELSEQVANIEELVPAWMRNRRKDYRSGENRHILRSELDNTHRDDLNRLKKIQSYRGIRHERGQKVRGQRTRSNGRTGLSLGVQRSEVQAQEE